MNFHHFEILFHVLVFGNMFNAYIMQKFTWEKYVNITFNLVQKFKLKISRTYEIYVKLIRIIKLKIKYFRRIKNMMIKFIKHT